jgi:hypothetical protein
VNTAHVAERAIAYWSGELGADERAAMEAHARTCDACRDAIANVGSALGALSAWPKNPTVEPALEERVMSRVRGVDRTRLEQPSWRAWQAAAALVLGFGLGVAGFALGRVTSAPTGAVPTIALTDSTLRSYLLLLEEPTWPPAKALTRSGYGEWARTISNERRFVEAEKLTEEPGFRVNANGQASRAATSPNVSGWYVIKARSYDEAIAWARRGPHLEYGSVLVREIENTARTVPRVQ